MEKKYVLAPVAEFRKDRKGHTYTYLKVSAAWQDFPTKWDSLFVTTPDDETPELDDVFLVTIEKLPKPATKDLSGVWSSYQDIVKKRQEEDAVVKPAPSGRKFR